MSKNRFGGVGLVVMLGALVGCGDDSEAPPVPPASVHTVQLFYNGSVWDDVGEANAISLEKKSLLPGETATGANVSGYVHGINGILLDVNGLHNTDLSAKDFSFRSGTDSTWGDAVAPTVTILEGQGMDDSDRIVLRWNRGDIVNTWLEITFLGNEATGLESDFVFYFGSLVGDTNFSVQDGEFRASLGDLGIIAERASTDATGIDDPADLNKDNKIDQLDVDIFAEANGQRLPVLEAPIPPQSRDDS